MCIRDLIKTNLSGFLCSLLGESKLPLPFLAPPGIRLHHRAQQYAFGPHLTCHLHVPPNLSVCAARLSLSEAPLPHDSDIPGEEAEDGVKWLSLGIQRVPLRALKVLGMESQQIDNIFLWRAMQSKDAGRAKYPGDTVLHTICQRAQADRCDIYGKAGQDLSSCCSERKCGLVRSDSIASVGRICSSPTWCCNILHFGVSVLHFGVS